MFKKLIRRQKINFGQKKYFSNDSNNNFSFLDKLNLENYLNSIAANVDNIKFWTMLNGCVSILTLFIKK